MANLLWRRDPEDEVAAGYLRVYGRDQQHVRAEVEQGSVVTHTKDNVRSRLDALR